MGLAGTVDSPDGRRRRRPRGARKTRREGCPPPTAASILASGALRAKRPLMPAASRCWERAVTQSPATRNQDRGFSCSNSYSQARANNPFRRPGGLSHSKTQRPVSEEAPPTMAETGPGHVRWLRCAGLREAIFAVSYGIGAVAVAVVLVCVAQLLGPHRRTFRHRTHLWSLRPPTTHGLPWR
jgi:hypothetical protein